MFGLFKKSRKRFYRKKHHKVSKNSSKNVIANYRPDKTVIPFVTYNSKDYSIIPSELPASHMASYSCFNNNYYGDPHGANTSYAFIVNGMPNFSNMQACFQEYKVTKIEMKFVPAYNVASRTTDFPLPDLWFMTDYNDSDPFPTEASMDTYAGLKRVRFDKTHKFTFTPRVSVGCYTDAISPYGRYFSQPCPWLDTLHDDHALFGAKWGISFNETTSTNPFEFTLYVKYFIEFRKQGSPL